MLPHAWHQFHSIDRAALWLLAGFLIMFFANAFSFSSSRCPDEAAEHDHFSHSDHEHCEHSLAEQSARRLSWVGAAVGMTLHSLIDGVALAASVQAETDGAWARGLGAFLVILLHKPFDAMAISTLMRAGGRSKYPATWSTASSPWPSRRGGSVLSRREAIRNHGKRSVGGRPSVRSRDVLCIATSDLLPEIQFHTHDRIKLSFALMAGLGVAVLIGRFETSGHDHLDHDRDAPGVAQPAKAVQVAERLCASGKEKATLTRGCSRVDSVLQSSRRFLRPSRSA